MAHVMSRASRRRGSPSRPMPSTRDNSAWRRDALLARIRSGARAILAGNVRLFPVSRIETGATRRSLPVMTATLSARTVVFSGFMLICTGISAHDDDGTAWIVVRDEKTFSMHGDMKDLEKARKRFAELGPGYLWFRKDGKEYIVRDGKIIEEIE